MSDLTCLWALRCDFLYLFSNKKFSSEDWKFLWVTYQDMHTASQRKKPQGARTTKADAIIIILQVHLYFAGCIHMKIYSYMELEDGVWSIIIPLNQPVQFYSSNQTNQTLFIYFRLFRHILWVQRERERERERFFLVWLTICKTQYMLDMTFTGATSPANFLCTFHCALFAIHKQRKQVRVLKFYLA